LSRSLLFLALACGCSHAYKLSDMESRKLKSPYDTVDYFRAAVRAEDWDALYAMLSPKSQQWIDDEYGHGFLFKLGVGDLKYGTLDKDAAPEVKDMTVWELVHRARILKIEPDDDDPGRWWVQLVYDPLPGKPPLIDPKNTRFPLVNAPTPEQKRRFTVGLFEWLNR
jgi:hypothetical protein